MVLAAHRSRHHLLTDFLDPSIEDETDPSRRVAAWNLYDSGNPASPPYSDDYVIAYRQRQQDRNRRITAWAREQLEHMYARSGPDAERCFVVHGTMADPRWLDLSVEPNDRALGSYLGDPSLANDGPAGLARFTTTRSWLSQWSLDDAQVDGVDGASRISVPVLVIENTADDACPTSHTQAIFEAIPHAEKERHRVVGANHYYSGQRSHLDEAVRCVVEWIGRHRP
jgi:fermentation-respiration switch protein FrsA (DUF1100 family)